MSNFTIAPNGDYSWLWEGLEDTLAEMSDAEVEAHVRFHAEFSASHAETPPSTGEVEAEIAEAVAHMLTARDAALPHTAGDDEPQTFQITYTITHTFFGESEPATLEQIRMLVREWQEWYGWELAVEGFGDEARVYAYADESVKIYHRVKLPREFTWVTPDHAYIVAGTATEQETE
jgi:hypothetical protein